MTKEEFIEKYGWEIIEDVPHRFVSRDFPEMNRVATTTEVILWNELCVLPYKIVSTNDGMFSKRVPIN